MATVTKSDTDIQNDLFDELSYDPQVDRLDIGVEVDDGVVTLTGTIGTFAEKWAAEDAAFRVAGVRAVANDIIVKLPGVGMPDDTELATSVANAIEHNALVPSGIKIRVANGTVTLEGEAEWHYQREAAEKAARAIRGVQGVLNRVRVVQPPVDAGEITKGIKRSLVRHAAVDADRVHVAVDGGHVILTGAVQTAAERWAAQDAAWRAKGVTAVTNLIDIRP